MTGRGRGRDLTNSPLGPVLRFVALLSLRAHMHEFLPRRMSVPNKIQLNANGDEWDGESSGSNN